MTNSPRIKALKGRNKKADETKMEKLQFTKMSGAGNDFIVIDNRDGKLPEEGRREQFEKWCTRLIGIGADGVLLVENHAGTGAAGDNGTVNFRMRYYNADGGEADSCGNGARCIARFANLIGAAPKNMSFETRAGLYRATVIGEDIRLTMSNPHSLRRDVKLTVSQTSNPDQSSSSPKSIENLTLDYINTGVPHAIQFVPDVLAVPVVLLGRQIRYHSAFAPAGTNANFAQVLPDGRIAMRTYERGVEDETLACGTGAIAVALIAKLKNLANSPVTILTSGGPVLKIYFEADAESFTNVKLEGEARVVYEGSVVFDFGVIPANA